MERLVGKEAPDFEMSAVMADKTFGKVSLTQYLRNGKWCILFFYPMDFSQVCPTEIVAINDCYEEFEDLNAEVLGISTDSIYTHLAWLHVPRERKGIGPLHFPLAADKNMRVSKSYGVLIEEEGIALRSLFIISPQGEVQYQTVFHNNVGRDVDEILRVLQALQHGGLCPANWRPGQATL